jgi:hypothetical protein
MENSYESLSVAINALVAEGYTADFNLAEEGITSPSLKSKWKAGDCDVIKYYRFEGMSNPDDNSILYVIETTDGTKGLLVDNYSADAGNVSPEMLEKLKIRHD